jgi:hypothetical protein
MEGKIKPLSKDIVGRPLGYDSVWFDCWLQLFSKGLLLIIDGGSIDNHLPGYIRRRKPEYQTHDQVPARKHTPSYKIRI